MNQGKMIGLGLIALVFFVLDRALKWRFFVLGGEFFVNDWFKLKLALNPGLAFGLPSHYFLIVFLYFLVLFFLIWFSVKSWREKKVFSFFFLVLVIGGAFSNLLDRWRLGQVIDYFDLRHYSVFNLADTMICLGIAGMLAKEIFKKKVQKKRA